MRLEKESMMKALAYCNLPKLPEEDTNEYVWVKAIGLVAKADGTKAYVLIHRNRFGRPNIVKDFGTISTIVKTEKIFPILMLDESQMPKFKTDKIEDRVKWMKRNGIKADYDAITMKEAQRLILNYCMYNAVKEDKLFKN